MRSMEYGRNTGRAKIVLCEISVFRAPNYLHLASIEGDGTISVPEG